MNYGKKFLYIMLSGAGMMITVIGIAYKTGYFPGHSDMSANAALIIGIVITILGLANLRKY